MEVFVEPTGLRNHLKGLKQKGTVSLVPTMGYIHTGHLEVINVARKNSDFVIVSIFVNPTQFDDRQDYNNYPREIGRDKELLKEANVDVLYLPNATDIYPEGAGHTSIVLLNPLLTQNLCGATRKGHFEGVMLVVSKLLNLIQPDVAVFGEKDYQQYIILSGLVDELLYPIKVLACPIIREDSGLAMSSRNARLTEDGLVTASKLYKSLKLFKSDYIQFKKEHGIDLEKKENLDLLMSFINLSEKKMIKMINENVSTHIDYVQILDAETLHLPTKNTKKLLAALAVYLEKVRLIDNIVVPI